MLLFIFIIFYGKLTFSSANFSLLTFSVMVSPSCLSASWNYFIKNVSYYIDYLFIITSYLSNTPVVFYFFIFFFYFNSFCRFIGFWEHNVSIPNTNLSFLISVRLRRCLPVWYCLKIKPWFVLHGIITCEYPKKKNNSVQLIPYIFFFHTVICVLFLPLASGTFIR